MNIQLDPQSKTEKNAVDHFRSDVLNGLQNTPKKNYLQSIFTIR